MNTKRYDLIIVPGLKLGPKWGMPLDLRTRLQKAAELYAATSGVRIVVSGRWSIWFDWLDIKPPVTEAKRMKDYLVRRGVKPQDIIMETQSKDTPGNAYYLKRYIRTKPQYKKLLVICTQQNKERVSFLFDTFFGAGYSIDYLPMKAPRFSKNHTGNEAVSLRDQKELLAHVRPGHEEDFAHQLYKSAYYTRQARAVRATR